MRLIIIKEFMSRRQTLKARSFADKLEHVAYFVFDLVCKAILDLYRGCSSLACLKNNFNGSGEEVGLFNLPRLTS